MTSDIDTLVGASRLPAVGTTIFTVMSALAARTDVKGRVKQATQTTVAAARDRGQQTVEAAVSQAWRISSSIGPLSALRAAGRFSVTIST